MRVSLAYADVSLGEWLILKSKEVPVADLDWRRCCRELMPPPTDLAEAACVVLLFAFVVTVFTLQVRSVRRDALRSLQVVLDGFDRGLERLDSLGR